MRRPKTFNTFPQATLSLERNTSQEVFSAYYERSLIPDMPLYEVAAVLTRTRRQFELSQQFAQNDLITVYAEEPRLKLALEDASLQSRSVEVVGGNSWMVLRTYTDASKAKLGSVLYTKPVADKYIITFRLNFWESNTSARWRDKRLPLLIEMVRSVKITGEQD